MHEQDADIQKIQCAKNNLEEARTNYAEMLRYMASVNFVEEMKRRLGTDFVLREAISFLREDGRALLLDISQERELSYEILKNGIRDVFLDYTTKHAILGFLHKKRRNIPRVKSEEIKATYEREKPLLRAYLDSML